MSDKQGASGRRCPKTGEKLRAQWRPVLQKWMVYPVGADDGYALGRTREEAYLSYIARTGRDG